MGDSNRVMIFDIAHCLIQERAESIFTRSERHELRALLISRKAPIPLPDPVPGKENMKGPGKGGTTAMVSAMPRAFVDTSMQTFFQILAS